MDLLNALFGSTIKVRMISYYLNDQDAMHNYSSLSRILNISNVTTSRVVKKLGSVGILKCLNICRGCIIMLNKESEITKALITFLENTEK